MYKSKSPAKVDYKFLSKRLSIKNGSNILLDQVNLAPLVGIWMRLLASLQFLKSEIGPLAVELLPLCSGHQGYH